MSPKTASRYRVALMIAVAAGVLALAVCEALDGQGTFSTTDGAPWAPHVKAVDEALASKDLGAAVKAWHDASSAALGSRRWKGMADVADAYLRIGEAAGFRKPWEPRAREIYLSALFRARHERSLEGILRVADAFAGLGDRDVVEQALRIAERLADGPEALHEVQAARAHLTGQMLGSSGAKTQTLSLRP